MTDNQIDALWLNRAALHGGDLLPQLRDFARAVLALQQQEEPVAWFCQHVMTESHGIVESWLTFDKDEEPGLKTAPGTSFVVRTPLYTAPPALQQVRRIEHTPRGMPITVVDDAPALQQQPEPVAHAASEAIDRACIAWRELDDMLKSWFSVFGIERQKLSQALDHLAEASAALNTPALQQQEEPREAVVSDEQIEAVLRLPVADGEDVAFYLLYGCQGVSAEVETIMVREVARTVLAASGGSDSKLWCVNVSGPDDTYAMPSKEAALERANQMNIEFGRTPRHEYDPIMLAVVIEWPHSQESHADDLRRLASPSPKEKRTEGGAGGGVMKERPILFQGAMVRATLAGTKTQTRRVVKPQPEAEHDGEPYWHVGGYRAWQYRATEDVPRKGGNVLPCPYGQPGDRLWVRENGWERPFRTAKMMREGADTWAPYYFDADGLTWQDVEDFKVWGFKRRPSIHMRRVHSRILLEVAQIRVERLQAISEADAIAEGAITDESVKVLAECRNTMAAPDVIGVDGKAYQDARHAYRALWEGINGAGSWTLNPWVWAVEFRRVTTP